MSPETWWSGVFVAAFATGLFLVVCGLLIRSDAATPMHRVWLLLSALLWGPLAVGLWFAVASRAQLVIR